MEVTSSSASRRKIAYFAVKLGDSASAREWSYPQQALAIQSLHRLGKDGQLSVTTIAGQSAFPYLDDARAFPRRSRACSSTR
jgi:hypothetical protein